MLLEEIKKEFYNSIKERVGEKLTLKFDTFLR